MSAAIQLDPLADPITKGLDGYTGPKRAFELLAQVWPCLTVKSHGLGYIMQLNSTSIRVRADGAALSRAAQQLCLGGTTMWLDESRAKFLELAVRLVGDTWVATLKLIEGGQVKREWEVEPEQITYKQACNPTLLPALREPAQELKQDSAGTDELTEADFTFKDGIPPARLEDDPSTDDEASGTFDADAEDAGETDDN